MVSKRPVIDLDTPIHDLGTVGPRSAAKFARLGIRSVKQLLWHLPARYEDYTRRVSLGDLKPNEKAHVQGQIVTISNRRIFPRRLPAGRRGMTVTNAIIRDDANSVRAVWFNQPYILETLGPGTRVSLAGPVKLDSRGLYLASPTYEKVRGQLSHTSGLVPVYPETEGLTSKYLRFLIRPLLDAVLLVDHLPSRAVKRNGLVPLDQAIKQAHFPDSLDRVADARERLAFDELLLLQIKSLTDRRRMNELASVPVPFDQAFIRSFVQQLPFKLTRDQRVAAWEVLRDLQKPHPMNRLVQGDVGSGKTVVALIAALQVAHAGQQAAFLVPTEVLARQHFRTIRSLVHDSGIRIGLVTGSGAWLGDELVSKQEFRRQIAARAADIIVGTHAVIQKTVTFSRLVLVVVDEQHRFGVQQRAALVQRPMTGHATASIPHLLSLTATPIPRTLALTMFGDLDLSLIKEKPEQRRRTITKVVPPAARTAAYTFIRTQARQGRQIFVICPRIDIAEPGRETPEAFRGGRGAQARLLWAEVKAVKDEYQRLSREIFPDLRVAMLHGKLKPGEKERVMRQFREGSYDILVSTSVVEVGVDVPNASVMVVEGADRFGLAQLHQFRGRVGRDSHQSYCFLFSSGDRTANARLKALAECDDGFALAERDLALRGPGELLGIRQSGLSDLAMAALANTELIKKARAEAKTLLFEDPSLSHSPLLRARVEHLERVTHFE